MRLATERLVLRDLVADDWRDLHAFEGDPEVVRYQEYTPRTEEDCRSYIAALIEDAAADPRITRDLGITLPEEDRVIGRVGLHLAKPALREAAVWYVLGRSVRGRGYATEALRAMVGYGFGELELHRVYADIDPRNEASRRVVARLGFRLEAHHLENVCLKGEWCDTEIHALLRREWKG